MEKKARLVRQHQAQNQLGLNDQDVRMGFKLASNDDMSWHPLHFDHIMICREVVSAASVLCIQYLINVLQKEPKLVSLSCC